MASIAAGVVVGAAARFYMLRVDYRQYPSYPQGYVIHLSIGVIAAFLGAIVPISIRSGDYAASSFVALAATQFREVRDIERKTLGHMEETELVKRGTAYIEGIARVFEARNYLAMLTAAISALAVLSVPGGLPPRLGGAAALGFLVIAVLNRAMVGPHVADIAKVEPAVIEFDGPLLIVAGVVLVNIGREESRRKYLADGLAVKVSPKNPAAKATLSNLGQRQAMVHDASALLGVRMDVDEPEFTPVARRNPVTGDVVLAMIPAERNVSALVRAVERVPVLEAAVRKPLAGVAGRMAE